MTKSRKRILLSSIAMLLVALIALGSATFAWFTINKKVDANTMTVKAVTTSGLQITNLQSRSNDSDWGRSVSYNSTAITLKPVSYAVTAADGSVGMPAGYYPTDVNKSGGGAWTSADSSKFGHWATAPNLPLTGQTVTYGDETKTFGNNGYVAAYEMYVRSSEAAIAKQVTANITADAVTNAKDGRTFAKAALVNANGNIIAYYTDGNTSTQAYNPINSINTVGTATGIAATSDALAMNGVPAKATQTKFTLYVWFEGNDPDCDDNAQEYDCKFTVEFTLTDTDATT